MSKVVAYSVENTTSGYCVVDDAGALIARGRFEAARLMAALMNGEYGAVAAGSDRAAAECRVALTNVLRPMRGAGLPALSSALPLL